MAGSSLRGLVACCRLGFGYGLPVGGVVGVYLWRLGWAGLLGFLAAWLRGGVVGWGFR